MSRSIRKTSTSLTREMRHNQYLSRQRRDNFEDRREYTLEEAPEPTVHYWSNGLPIVHVRISPLERNTGDEMTLVGAFENIHLADDLPTDPVQRKSLIDSWFDDGDEPDRCEMDYGFSGVCQRVLTPDGFCPAPENHTEQMRARGEI